jgi:hypothetical protein
VREKTHKITQKNNKNAKSEENPQIPTQFNKISYKKLFFKNKVIKKKSIEKLE